MHKKRLYSRAVLILGANQLIETVAFSIAYSYFPQYAISLGASVASIGIFTSSFMFMSAVLSPYFGRYSDKFGRKRLTVLGLIGDIIFGALTGYVPSWQWLLVVRMINGAVTAAAMIPSEALLIDLVPPDRIGEASGFIMACAMIGINIGPLFGGTIQWLCVSYGLSEQDSYRIPYLVDAGFAAVSALLITLGIEESKVTLKEKEEGSENEEPTRISRPYEILLVATFITGIGEGFFRPIIVLFFSDIFGAKPIEIGLLMTLSGFTTLLASWIAGRASDRHGRKIVIVLGGIPARLLSSALPLSANETIASVFYTLRDFTWRVYIVGLRALRADLAPLEVRGRLFGLYRAYFSAGEIIGPVLATYLYDLYRFETFKIAGFTIPGYSVPFYLNTIIGMISLATIILFAKVKKKENEA